MTAKVKWFNSAKGFGFATLENGTDVFLHYTNIQMEGFKTLKDGVTVEFDLYEKTNHPGSYEGKNIKLI